MSFHIQSMQWHHQRFMIGAIAVMLACSITGHADEPGESEPAQSEPVKTSPATPEVVAKIDPAHRIFFESKVRPLLVEHCFSCHAEDEQKGGLRLDHRSSMIVGGDSGESIVPGNPDASLLIQAVRYESYEMPPDGQLADDQIEILERWIQIGAPWPGDDKAPVARSESSKFSPEDMQWWAIQPVTAPQVPVIADEEFVDWPRNDIDRFILKQMREKNLTPAPEADRETLIRRIYFDLIGLPPSPSDVNAFVADTREDAYEQLVDRLLDSPEYGERWARHWLDLVRYADSDGYRADHFRPEAWRFRDYVIDSFNQDKPYDQFVREQIAGDELYPGNPDALVATGYLRHGIYEWNIRDALGQWDVILNEVTDTTGDVFLGLGMQCARCHDHKFDPILQSDYYRLRAYFEPLSWRDDLTIASDQEREDFELQNAKWLEATTEVRVKIAEIEDKFRKIGREKMIKMFPLNVQEMFAKPLEERTSFEKQIVELAHRQVLFEYGLLDSMVKGEEKDHLLELRRELAQFDHLRPKPLPSVMAATDIAADPPPTIIPKKRREVTPGILTLIEEKKKQSTDTTRVENGNVRDTSTRLVAVNPSKANVDDPSQSLPTTYRRSELARWITDPQNPLSTRVIVNRVWQYHFGKGLAANSSDFGYLGGPPSHPEMLDWLTVQFLQNDWRLKPLHRMMVLSATYRQSSNHPQLQSHNLIDPANQMFWRANSRRLDAEQIRDAMLTVTGELDPRRGGPGSLPDQSRRSIYNRVMRNDRDPLLDAFDLPLFFSSSSSRDTTTTPIQSLMLFNSTSLLQRARSLADRVIKQSPGSDVNEHDWATNIDQLWRLVFGRAPRPSEAENTMAFLQSQTSTLQNEQELDTSLVSVTSQMPYRDGQSLLIKPDDSTTFISVPPSDRLQFDDFTLETFFQIRSIYDSGSVRTIAAYGSGGHSTTGWAMGITGKGSRRKPQTLVMQLFGPTHGKPNAIVEAALFSDQDVELNKPYYVGVKVRFAEPDKRGEVVFYLKDLSDDEKPIQIATMEHDIVSMELSGKPSKPQSLRIAGRGKDANGKFDGLIDDVRLSNDLIDEDALLFVAESVRPATVGYWRFESNPGFLVDSGPNDLQLASGNDKTRVSTPAEQAFVDLCHVLLNSNEFLYVY